MRVKRLEIQGFKSFKDKTVIHFDHTITGIVGPNGCGKSNIVDAFFWVMGEQSYKHMRGSGSDDLIFNGSSKYSPLGMAEATLVMETDVPDTEHGPAGASAADLPVHLKSKEIAVTRRLYRGGEGEYFINGVQARLKDIHELFMDTGVGAKGYSVIEQGQIGKIVNSKPEERRLLIEEAAGIAKYKARKKESLRKLEATQGNLSRLNDVIQEIERNLNSLERQAQKARQYRKYKDELLDKEMTWGRRKSLVVRARLESLKRERETLEQDLVVLKSELHIAENSIEVDRTDQLTDSKRAEDLQSRIQQLSSDLTQQRSALELSRRRQNDLNTQRQSLEDEKTQLDSAIEIEQEKLSTREIDSKEAESAYALAASQAATQELELRGIRTETDSARRKLDSEKRELMSLIAKDSELTSKAATLDARIEATRAQAERLAQQLETQVERLDVAREEAQKAIEAAEGVKGRREEMQVEKKTQAALLQEQEQTLREADRNRDQAAKKLTQLRSRLQSLEELAATHEGFGDGPKAALDWARAQGFADGLKPLADSLDVQPGYEAALEGWLENRLESLVASGPDGASIALQALEAISSKKQGRAAIFVAPAPAAGTTLEGSAESSAEGGNDASAITSLLTAAGFVVQGPLSQFVTANTKATEASRSLTVHLTGHVLVVQSLEPATALLANRGLTQLTGWSLIATDGASLTPDGLFRGGTTDSGAESTHAGSLLGRKRAIAELAETVQTAELEANTAEAAATELRETLELARAHLQSLQSELQALEIEAAGLDRDVHQMNRSLREAEQQLHQLESEQTQIQDAATRAVSDREAIHEQIEGSRTRRSELEDTIASNDTQLGERDATLRAQESEFQALRINEASLRERSSSLKRELEGSRSVLADRQRRLAEVQRILDRASREHEEHSGGDADLETRIQTLVQSLSETQMLLSEVKDRLEQSNTQLNSSLDRIKQLHAQGGDKTTQSNNMALEIEKLSGELMHLVQNLEEKYGPGCLDRAPTSPQQQEMTDPIITAEMSAEEELLLGEEVERLRERIRRLGEVNVMAIEEFEETQKRYQHICTEKTDLETSIQNLMEAIEHINKTSEVRFQKAFEAIKERFERLFPIIFGGGSAQLSLMYPEGSTDILEAGVDILAQPPGKKVSNITLLSGGEKALTAVSLIFAIFMVKPSPFCLLDEVDAPLDDANIGKFNALLREMSVKSQFILITHNKKTMELNDTLYGVTMEEPGVSKIVSIEMR